VEGVGQLRRELTECGRQPARGRPPAAGAEVWPRHGVRAQRGPAVAEPVVRVPRGGVAHAAGGADDVIGNSRTAMGPHLMARSDFRAGLRRLSALGLSLDAWQFHPQLADTVDLARAFPNANIIVGHCGGPLGYGPYAGKKDEVFAAWKPPIVELAKCENVTMKLGGMMMRLAAFGDLSVIEASAAGDASRLRADVILAEGVEIDRSTTPVVQLVNDASAAILGAVAGLGVRICVDDFGTGYSALAYLKRLPVSAIKIDKTFVQDIARDPHDEGIVKAMCTLAETLGLRVVAEGVETQAQFELVKSLGCRYVQGFYFHRPQSWSALRTSLGDAPGSRHGAQVISLRR